MDNLVPRVLKGNYDPVFAIEHFLKDMEIALSEAALLNLSLPGLSLVQQLYRSAMALGHGKREPTP